MSSANRYQHTEQSDALIRQAYAMRRRKDRMAIPPNAQAQAAQAAHEPQEETNYDTEPSQNGATSRPVIAWSDELDLLPCPFCGGKAEFDSVPAHQDVFNAGGVFIICTTRACLASSALIFPSGDDPKPLLAERWNRRVGV